MKTIGNQIRALLFNGATLTATDIARATNRKLSSVSSKLHKMWVDGEVSRIKGFGPLGGYGYRLRPFGDAWLRSQDSLSYQVKTKSMTKTLR